MTAKPNLCPPAARAALAAAIVCCAPVAHASPISLAVLSRYVAAIAPATVRPVTSCADDGSAGTLRAVVALAGSGDTLDLSGLPAADPACTSSTITLTQGEIAIPHNLTVLGPSDTTLTVAAGGQNRVFNSSSVDTPSAYLQVTSLTISGGAHKSRNMGGCIYAKNEVRLDRAIVTDCVAYSPGGGSGKYFGRASGGGVFAGSVVMSNGSLVANNVASAGNLSGTSISGGGVFALHDFNCTDSTVSGNASLGVAGGIGAYGYATLDGCTVDSNSAKYAGGLFAWNSAGSLNVNHSTFSGNSGGKGGAIYSKAPATIRNSTIAFNQGSQSFAGGIHSVANVAMYSSIVAHNRNDNAINADLSFGSGGSLTGADNLVMSVATFPPGVIVSALDPKLAPLGNHGGLTRTHALLAGSPAIDLGNNSGAFATDQRGAGFAREVPSGEPDIGAYERQANEDEIFGNGFD